VPERRDQRFAVFEEAVLSPGLDSLARPHCGQNREPFRSGCAQPRHGRRSCAAELARHCAAVRISIHTNVSRNRMISSRIDR
jgi:hypothetical protein